ncbi:hypothetical protein SAMN05421774_102215 [Gemmobacter megaterium]|uniref:Uncharacterized protein n=1 Tax=Gemmobacter megaterium TaxID=1086013 RepID=A0A1N7LW73_9RHOB|nr:hypothetical protein [Gemmobacter megaterium]GGE10293.1 hypothetical protein GCM10011345_15220 [Gemmobacter megaterium]SIS78105.1 hypothetical protein SAMN05421774_102215 [Gemmobacter megaterium]
MNLDMQSRLHRLATLAALIQDRAQASLRHHTQACAETRQHLANLDTPAAAPAGIPPQVMENVAVQHQQWAGPQRARLNAVLARQTADRMAAETAARTAFGRAHVLNELLTRQRPGRD